MTSLFARHAFLPQGWCDDVLLEWDANGTLTTATPNARAEDADESAQLVVPGMVNLHSHAFQRALAGLTEKGGDSPDSFWTWRELMYRFARHITPLQMESIAAQLYVECLRHGYTSVCEFHYIHRDPNGEMYTPPAETAERVIAAAALAGIGMTMLPVLYTHSGFGEQPLKQEQLRFRTDARDILRIIDALEPLRSARVEVGVAPHSLRAASAAEILRVLQTVPKNRPVHIHIAEQQGEVEQSLAYSGKRPVRYLLDEIGIDRRWCLVHATHLSPDEVDDIARSGAVVGLCPTTEANLGDGLFPLAPYLSEGGYFGIGSDSHVSQSPIEELRWLEYGQRLQHQRRNIACTAGERQVGDFLWRAALEGGARASGRPVGALESGRRADLLVLDAEHPNLYGTAKDAILGTLIFSGNDNLVRDVLVGGNWLVRRGVHSAQDVIAQRFRQTIDELRRIPS
ncbi:formimidoylglutamate deiminase [Massilia arenosa]|uniref:Formimidoylglutamate deiminase n=1 Tax=Zemynaea arenosa TaxID=2561931 RepID=A0A4Y9SVU0_9BURK|nr:formimidoylglutamate deiminase [Massilia arenosa]TFW28856.1 formimidoylglutamate deiminase [Massilia arenosa]